MSRTPDFNYSNQLRQRAHDLIAAGCHTYSKGDDQFPAQAPGFIVRGKGSHCWDVDGNEFVDWGMGLRSVILGHAYHRVIEAVRAQLEFGSNFTRPSPVEVELAELLVGLIPSAEMVKFAKNGSDVTTAAVRLARAYTGRDYVARCRDNPFFAVHDWFIGSTPMNAGIPQRVRDLTLLFDYNHLETLEALFQQYPSQIACVILEPVSTQAPQPGYLEAVRDLTRRNGAVLIFDEIISGFRWDLKGAQNYFGVTPDMSTFGKAIGNGFSVSALAGRRDIMELGGLHHKKPRVFLLSSTHGGETHELAACIATISELRDKDAIPYMWRIGQQLQDGFNSLAKELGIAPYVSMEGYPCSPYLLTKGSDGQVSMEYRTLFLQEVIARGVLIPYIAISYSHTTADVEQTLDASRHALSLYREALERGDARPFFEGQPVKPVFRAYN